MLSQFFAYSTDSRVGSYNITVLNSYNCLFIVDKQWRMAGKPTMPAKDNLHIMLIAMLSQVCVIIETAEYSRRIFCSLLELYLRLLRHVITILCLL